MKNKWTWMAVGAIALIAIVIWALLGGKKEENIAYETAIVEIGNIQNSITATGTIEPVTSVTVGTQVSGIVSKLYVDYNSIVKKDRSLLNWTRLISSANSTQQKRTLPVPRVHSTTNRLTTSDIKHFSIKD